MCARLVDLSVPIDPAFWEPEPVRRVVIDHRAGADLLGRDAGVTHRDFPGELGLSLMHYTLTTHTGTHMDAPFHYGPRTTSGDAARTICQVPLEWCYSHGVLLDVTGDVDRPVERAEVEAALRAIDHELQPLDIVLLRTAGDRAVGEPGYFQDFRGISRDATELLVERGVRVIGVDSFGFDPPFARMLGEYERTRDSSGLWPAHVFGREREYCQIERLTNLADIGRPTGFTVACFPIKLARADAAWCRVVAIEDG